MAAKEDILEAISNMTVIELKELLDAFEEKFDVTAAAPVAVAAGRRCWRRGGRPGRRGEGRVRRHPHRCRRPEDPGHQGRARADQPRPEGGQGPRRRCSQARAREGRQGRRRGRQGQARRGRRQRRAEVSWPAERHRRRRARVSRAVARRTAGPAVLDSGSVFLTVCRNSAPIGRCCIVQSAFGG